MLLRVVPQIEIVGRAAATAFREFCYHGIRKRRSPRHPSRVTPALPLVGRGDTPVIGKGFALALHRIQTETLLCRVRPCRASVKAISVPCTSNFRNRPCAPNRHRRQSRACPGLSPTPPETPVRVQRTARPSARRLRRAAAARAKLAELGLSRPMSPTPSPGRGPAADAVAPAVPECRDPFDRPFLELALTARADALVTGDADLQAPADIFAVPILTPAGLKRQFHDADRSGA